MACPSNLFATYSQLSGQTLAIGGQHRGYKGEQSYSIEGGQSSSGAGSKKQAGQSGACPIHQKLACESHHALCREATANWDTCLIRRFRTDCLDFEHTALLSDQCFAC